MSNCVLMILGVMSECVYREKIDSLREDRSTLPFVDCKQKNTFVRNVRCNCDYEMSFF